MATMRTIKKKDFQRVSPYIWQLPVDYRDDMRVPARLYADEELLEATLADRSLEQLANTATLPGIVKYAMAMPDIHQGYGFPIGGVVATKLPHGVISPGGVGYDINCGVRLLATKLLVDEITPHLSDLATALYRNCPSGVGVRGSVKVSGAELDKVLTEGSRWALRKGMARQEDVNRTEEQGKLAAADPAKVSERARKRGRPQLGTLGAGNHFIELDVVDEVLDEATADVFGLQRGQITVQIHCGSRGFGHQVCSDYVRRFQSAVKKYGITLPDRELVCAPWDSPDGQDYYAAMACAANYAFANRQVLTHHVRRSFAEALSGKGFPSEALDVRQVYDIAHNMAKVETHIVDGRRERVCVHRKGATRAFGPGSDVLPKDYREVGQPVLVPGSMGTASYVLVGTERAMAETFGSTCHGAGRTMSRKKAKKGIRGEKLRAELEAGGIHVRAGSMAGLAEEAPAAYKDVCKVVEVVEQVGIARPVVRLRPLAVIKG
jgi:tRNA-splicing ligase RtcB